MTEGLNVTHIYDVFLGVCVQDNGCSGTRWFSMLKGGLNFQANHFLPLLPPDPGVFSFAVCLHLCWGRSWLSVSHPSHSSTTHLAWHWQTSACCSPVWCLRGPAPGMGGVFLFCPGTPWESGCLAGLWASMSSLDSSMSPSLLQFPPPLPPPLPAPLGFSPSTGWRQRRSKFN